MTRIINCGSAITQPLPDTPFHAGAPLYRATFGLGDTPNLVGVPTAAGEGLSVAAWEGVANALAVASGRVVRGSATGAWFNGLPTPASNGINFSMLVVTRPTVAGVYFDVFRSTIGGSPDSYRLEFGTSTVRLCKRLNGAFTYFGNPEPYVNGDRVGLVWVKGMLTLSINGKARITANDSTVTPSGYCGIAGTSATTGFQLDNLEVNTY